MADTLKRLAGPTALAAAAATVYTVPAATTTTITNIHVSNETATSQSFILSIGTDGAGKRVFYNIDVAPRDAFDWTGTLVLAATEVVQAYASAATSLTFVMSGVETA